MFLSNVGQIVTSSLSVTTKATKLASEAVLTCGRCGRNAIEIVNSSASDVFIGGEGVTTSTGVPVKAGASKVIPVNHSAAENLYIVAGSSVKVILAEYFA